MERRTITISELHTAMHVPKMQDSKTIELFEKGYLQRLEEGESYHHPRYKGFFFNARKNALVAKNLTIKVNNSGRLYIMDRSDVLFDDLIFESDTASRLAVEIQTNATLVFIENKFKKLDLKMYINNNKAGTFVDIHGSNFSSHVNFHLYSEVEKNILVSAINLNDNTFEQALCISDDIHPEDEANYSSSLHEKQYYELSLTRNRISKLEISNKNKSYCGLSCNFENRIVEFGISDELPKITSWGFNEKIIMEKNKTAIDTNRSTFMALRKRASDEGNRLHEVLFQHHITECDEALIKSEPEGFARQEKITMLMGRVISNHGTSWLRPALILLGINFLIAVLATIPSGLEVVYSYSSSNYNFGDFLSVYYELFNPLGNLNNIECEPCLAKKIWSASLLTVISKFFYAICAYEFIRAARRFTPR